MSFSKVDVYYFQRSQSYDTVPSLGGIPMGKVRAASR